MMSVREMGIYDTKLPYLGFDDFRPQPLTSAFDVIRECQFGARKHAHRYIRLAF